MLREAVQWFVLIVLRSKQRKNAGEERAKFTLKIAGGKHAASCQLSEWPILAIYKSNRHRLLTLSLYVVLDDLSGL